MEQIKAQTIEASLTVLPESQSMDYLLNILNILDVDIARLDHGELTSIHETIKDLIDLARHGDPEADWRIYDGLSQATDRGFSAYSVEAAFRG